MSTDPITLAREVLETAHEDETVTVCSVPDNKAAALAHTVRRTVPALDAVLELHKPVQARMTSSDGVRDVTYRIHFKNGEKVDEFVGVRPKSEIVSKIQAQL